MEFIKWYLIEHVIVMILTIIVVCPFVIYALIAALEYHLWGTKIMAYMAAALYYGAIIAFVLFFPIKAVWKIRQHYKRHKRSEDGSG